MYIVPIAWLYVAFMMALAEATSTQGTVVGAVITFVLYGLIPIALMMYILGTPGRKRKLRAQEQEALAAANAAVENPEPSALVNTPPDASHLPPTHPVAPVREET